MAIQQIQIEEFTVFKNFKINLSKGINIFIGENGTGKTHLLKLLYAHCGYSFGEIHDFSVLNKLDKVFGHRNIKNWCNLPFAISNCITRPAVFIPAKDMLTHSLGLLEMSNKYANMPFDGTLLEIIEKANHWVLKDAPEMSKNILSDLKNVMGGTIVNEDNEFFIIKNDGQKINFSMEAEGVKKFGLLWQLIMNENLTRDTVLIWDEPEANLNPKLISVLIDILLKLARQEVQIFLSTHDYNLMKYFSIKKQAADQVCFHSLFKTENGLVACNSNSDYELLEHNPIVEANIQLLEDKYNGGL